MENRVISFSGLDGSGKTTCAGMLYEYLRENGRRAVLLNIYKMSLLLSIGRLCESAGIKPRDDTPAEVKKESPVKIALRSAALLVDIFIFIILSAVLKARGAYIVCDRYPYDTLAHILYKGRLPEKMVDFYMGIIPVPGLAFLLSTDAHTAKVRENAHAGIDYFLDKGKIYNELKRKAAFDLVETNGSIGSSWEKIRSRVDSKIMAR